MTTLYKLTDQHWKTYNGTKWGPGVTHTASGTGKLCSSGWLHAYTSPELAILLNPIHAGFADPILWEADGEIGINDRNTKVGCKALTTIRIITAPTIYVEDRIRFGILCAKEVYKGLAFLSWANEWLEGIDRSNIKANNVIKYANAAAAAALNNNRIAAKAAYATSYAATAAKAASYAANAAIAAKAATAASYAANAANTYDAFFAANAAIKAASAANLNLIQLAKQAVYEGTSHRV